MYKLALIFISSVFVAMSPAVAAGAQDKWIVTQLTGDARLIHPGLQPASLKVNSQIVSGDTLVTGPTGRATLVRGADYIIIAPRSELRLPATPESTGFTRVVEKLGTMLFKIQHTGIPHFAVDTPMLAAVVKGTTFSITVDQNRSAVQVIQGAVQVTAVEGGMRRIVEGGRTVFVNHAQPKVLLDADRPPPATEPSSNSVQVTAASDNPLASISQLTSGLVRVEADSPQTPARVAVSTPTPVATATAVSPASTASPATTPAVTVAGNTTPSVSTPSLTTTPVTVASASTPVVAVPGVSIPAVTVAGPGTTTVSAPSVTVGPVSTPTVTVASLSTPTVTVPSVTVGSVSTPTVTVPTVSTPTVTVPTITTPTISTPTITVPSITVPSVTTPIVSIPAITTPTVTIPSVTIHCLIHC